MYLLIISIATALLSGLNCLALYMKIENQCSTQTVWPAITANSNMRWFPDPLGSGIALQPGQHVNISLPYPWAGRLWGRLQCTESIENCLVSDCGSASCWDTAAYFATLLELSIAENGVSWDLSLVDGFTTGMKVIMGAETAECTVHPYLGLDNAGHSICPVDNLVYQQPTTGFEDLHKVIGCLSECKRLGRPQDCCPPGQEGRELCRGSSPWFKQVCPRLYSYASDDTDGMRFSNANTMSVIFTCPP